MFFLLCVFPKKIEFYQGNNMSLSQSDVRNVWQRLSGTTTFNCAKKNINGQKIAILLELEN